MPGFAQALDLVDDEERIAAYEEYHEQVWPEVLEGLRCMGIQRMQIFRTGTRLFMYYEAEHDFDLERALPAYLESARCQEWEQLMRTYQRQVPTADDAAWWTPMELVFDLEAQ